MTDPSGRYTIAFNGEIYNYQSLRQELEQQGVAFHSKSDTEVLLQLYIHEGERCLNKLNGFFAFAVYDEAEDTMFVARDRLGIKPLYYYLDEDKFLFSSEMRSLLAYNIPRELDAVSLYQYLQLSYIPAPATIFKQVHKLPPGHWIRVKKGEEARSEAFYEVPFSEGCTYEKSLGYEEAQRHLMALLDESVQLRMIADVPVGAFLSGGIDSSTIVALASRHTQHLNTFSVGYKDEPMFDETRYAKLVADRYKTEHTVFTLTNDDFYEHIFDLLDGYGEPFADASQIPVYILSQRTRRKVTVALSGDGADEVFGGYNKYLGEFKARERGLAARLLHQALPLWERLPQNRNSFLGNRVRQFHRFASSMDLSPQERYWFLCTWRSEADAQALLQPGLWQQVDAAEYARRKQAVVGAVKGKDFNEVLYADVKMLLPNDMLHKVDSMSMAHALEVRVPFLDHRVVNFAFSLPASYKINGNMKKRLLQDAVRDLLPKELYKRPKHGFDVPLAKGYKRELKSWIEGLLDPQFVAEQGIFRPEALQQLQARIFGGTNFDQNQVWALLAFQHWWKKYMK
jgi:asparagine synthase (glutamine-hydrolysing)